MGMRDQMTHEFYHDMRIDYVMESFWETTHLSYIYINPKFIPNKGFDSFISLLSFSLIILIIIHIIIIIALLLIF